MSETKWTRLTSWQRPDHIMDTLDGPVRFDTWCDAQMAIYRPLGLAIRTETRHGDMGEEICLVVYGRKGNYFR
jgi:hypothetical protein